MKKNYLHILLMAVVVGSLSLSVTSCSDDDDDKNGGGDAGKEQSVMPADANDDATVLGSLLQSWVEDFTADDVTPAILNQTFVPTVGEVIDESNATVRSLVVGTQAAADDYAKGTLSLLGISSQQPAGFSWKNAAIGSISYSHGSGNELGVITVSVKQLPGLTKIRLVKDYEGNAPKTAYYQKGDIVKYTGSGVNKDHYFICLNDHSGGNEAIWISFDLGTQAENLSYGTCGWMSVGDDVVYNKEQASSDNLRIWLQEFLLNDQGYQNVMENIQFLPLSAKNQILPSSEALRKKLIDSLTYTQNNLMLELNRDGNDLKSQYPTALMSNGVKYEVLKQSGNTEHRCYYPWRLLLTGSMRWSMGFTYDYWVPYVILVKKADSPNVEHSLSTVTSQYYDTSHFTWDKLASDVRYNGETYNVYRVALHWTHEVFELTNGKQTKKYKMLIDFTKHKYDELDKEIDPSKASDLDWTLHNITSHELKVKDNGERYKYFEDVYRAKDGVKVITNDFVGNPHYEPGDVYTDEEGCRWFCFFSAGYNQIGADEVQSPYSYFVTFDGLKFDASDRKCTNLPSRELAMKAVLGLQQINVGRLGTAGIGDKVEDMKITFDEGKRQSMIWNIWNAAGVSLIDVLQVHKVNINERMYFVLANVAYNSDDNDQRVMRFVNDGYENADYYYYFWDHYPTEPFTAYSKGGPKSYSTTPIRLQDITQQPMVQAHADDYYVKTLLLSNGNPGVVRTAADANAAKASNFVYNAAKFANGTQPLSMWNEPVMLFRVTKVFDKGDDNYSERTVDGHTLTAKSLIPRDNMGVDIRYITIDGVMGNMGQVYKNTRLDGKQFTMPKWNEDWK